MGEAVLPAWTTGAARLTTIALRRAGRGTMTKLQRLGCIGLSKTRQGDVHTYTCVHTGGHIL